MRSSRSIAITCAALLLVPAAAMANGFYVPGVGSRASAMGGAFIGLADDYSAVYWNPAGITQIKGMEVTGTLHDLVTLASRDGNRLFDGSPGEEDGYRFASASIGVTSESQNRVVPGAFLYADPGPARGLVDKVGLAIYTLTDYGVKWDGNDVISQQDLLPGGFDMALLASETPDYETRVRTYVASPMLAREIIPGLSVGVAGNIAYSHFERTDIFFEEVSVFVDNPDPTPDAWVLAAVPIEGTDDVTGWGYGATVGALYRATSEISVGLTVRSPMTVNYDGTYAVSYRVDVEEAEESFEDTYKSDFEIRYPLWAGLGLSYRDFLFDGLTMNADLQWTRWSNIQRIARNIKWHGEITEDGTPDAEVTPMNWEDTLEFALGFDYRVGRSVSVNMGYRNSPSPVPSKTYNFVMPSASTNTIALGMSYRTDFWRLAAALEYRAGDVRRIRGTYDMNGKYVTDLLAPSLSLTYAF